VAPSGGKVMAHAILRHMLGLKCDAPVVAIAQRWGALGDVDPDWANHRWEGFGIAVSAVPEGYQGPVALWEPEPGVPDACLVLLERVFCRTSGGFVQRRWDPNAGRLCQVVGMELLGVGTPDERHHRAARLLRGWELLLEWSDAGRRGTSVGPRLYDSIDDAHRQFEGAVAQLRRDKTRISQTTVATALGMSQQTVSKYIRDGWFPPLPSS